MNVYVETNFVLELALMQEQHVACRQVLEICTDSKTQLVVPAYSLIEPYETLFRRKKDRKLLADKVNPELMQLSRSAPYHDQINSLRPIIRLLTQSGDEEIKRLDQVREKLLKIAEIIPLGQKILSSAQTY